MAVYWLDDDTSFSSDSGNSKKIALDSALVESDKNHYVLDLSNSIFNNSGDDIAIFNTVGDIIDQYKYTSDPKEDISLGRTPYTSGQIQL